MDIANSTFALVEDRSVLPVSALKERASSIAAQLAARSVKAGDRVIVFISNKTWLLPALWAMLRRNVTGIVVETSEDIPDLSTIAGEWKASCIITEKKYLALSTSFDTIIVDEQVATAADEEQIDGTVTTQFIFHSSGNFISHASLHEYFAELDAALMPSVSDIMMLSERIPYEQQVIELLWASSRGIPVVIGQLSNDRSLARFTQSGDRFPMEFGLFHFGSYMESSETNKYRQLFDTVQFADKNGFRCVWTPERHFNEFGGLFPNPSVLSAAIAVSTSRVQIRCGSIVAPLHHPVRIAEDWSLIDNLSNGRAAISFASGWQCDDFIFFPENYAQRHDCMMHTIDTVMRLWRGEKLPFRNGLGKDVEIGIFPKPIQNELPVWVTVSGRTETFVDAGRIGANILTHLLWQDSDELIDKIAAYRKSLADNGYDPRSRTVSVMVHTYLGSDNETVKNKVREPLKNYIRTSTQLIQAMVKSTATSTNAKDIAGRYGGLNDEVPAHLMDELVEIAFNRFFEQAALLGSLDKAAKLLKKLKVYDVDEIAALIDFGLSRDDIMEGLVYLNKLREMYDKEAMATYPVTITHCSLHELEELQKSNANSAFLNAQRTILLDANDERALPENILQKTRIVHAATAGLELTINISRPVLAPADAFMAAISSDFD